MGLATSILAAIRRQANQIPDALVLAFPPPPVQGIGNARKLQIEDRRSAGLAALNEAANAVIAKARQQPGLAGLFTSYRYNVPQIHLDIDRRKAETLPTLPGVSSGQAIQMMEQICRETLPPQFGFEWAELSLQQILTGNSAVYIFALCVVFVFLVLAGLYELGFTGFHYSDCAHVLVSSDYRCVFAAN